MTDNHENITLKEKIKKKLKESDYSPDMKAELEQLNNSTNSQQVRKMIWAVLEDNEDMFINNLENPGTLSSEEEHNVERLIGLYETFVVSCIRENDSVQLTTLLYYCSVSRDGREPGPVLAGIFAKICCIGYKDCLDVVLRKIFLNKVAEDFMKTAVAEKLFDVNFYRRIVEHDRVPLLQALYSKSDAWKKDVMTKLADERKYRNVAAYLKDPEGYKMISDPRKRLPYDKRIELAEKLQAAVKMGDILNLEKCLQDLEGCKEVYSNLDNLLNETVSREPGIWKGERLMHLACRQGALDICKALYRKGASLRVLDVNFHSPAHVAVEADQLHVLQWLNECDNKLILDFFDYGWKDPFLKDDKYLFRLKTGNVNLPVLAYLLTLGCDKLLDEENIDHVLNQALRAEDIDYSCIDTLLKGEQVRSRITPDQLKEAAKKDDQLLSMLLAAAPKKCIEKIIENDEKFPSPFLKDWRQKCPEALPEVFSKFVNPWEDVNKNGKKIFKEISKLKDVRLLNHPTVSGYIAHNLITILPYYIDVLFICIHLACISWYCVTYGLRNAPVGPDSNYQSGSGIGVWYCFLIVTILLSVKQIIEFCIERSQFVNAQDSVETVSYVLSFFILFRFLEQWELVVIILCLFISWADLFMKLKIIPPKLGLYMEMFYSILKTFISILLMFSMFLLCFSTAFYTLFHKAEPFQSFPSIAGKTLAMMTGEFDFDGLFFPQQCPSVPSQALFEFDAISTTINAQNPTTTDVSSNFTEPPISSGPAAPSQVPTTGPQYPPTAPGITHQNIGLLEAVEYPSIVAYYVFFVFCICLHILLLNLLVGLAVDDISKIMDDSKGRRLRKQAELIADLEILWSKAEGFYERITLIQFVKWISACFRCRRHGNLESDAESGEKGTASKEDETLLKGLARQPSMENRTLLNKLRRLSQGCGINWLFVLLGLQASKESAKETISEINEMNGNLVEMRDEFERKRQEEREETTKTLDLMKEVIFQLDKRNRDLIDVIKEIDSSNRELKKDIREVDKRTRDILDRLPPLSTEQ